MYINEPTVLTMGELNVMCYPPLNNSDSNESGICYLCSSNDLDMLITGDMDTKTEEMLLNKYDLPLIEILIAGHHGSKSSTSELLLDTIKPQTVIASVGENSYNHLSQDFLRRVVSRGLYLYRTDEQGNITIKFK